MFGADLDLLDHIALPVFVIEPDDVGRPVFRAINQAGSQLFGLPPDKVLGRTTLELFPTSGGPMAYVRQLKSLMTAAPASYRIRFRNRPGAPQFETQLTPKRAANGRVQLVGVIHPVENTTRNSNHDKQRGGVDQDFADLFYLAAHDLRSPLNQIRTLADLLRDTPEEGDLTVAELLDMLEAVSTRASSMIEEVMSHALASNARASSTRFCMQTLVGEIMKLLDPLGRAAAEAPPIIVECDATLVKFTLRNLIDNALKHAAPGIGSLAGAADMLRMDVQVAAEQGGRLRIILSDNGPGFHRPETIFGGRPESATNGFGLFAVRKMLQKLGGQISASNGPLGHGGVIEFDLPGRLCGADRVAGLAA